MFVFTLPVIIGLAGLVLAGARLGYVLWKGAKATAIERKMLEFAAAAKGWAAYLLRRNREIDAQPDKTGTDLTDALNDEWHKKP